MEREIKFSLVFRDMWQSAGKYVPRVDQLVKVAPAIVEMGCFARVETNGGGFEQVNLLFGCSALCLPFILYISGMLKQELMPVTTMVN